MKAGILSVGTELLLGDTVNTNATFIAKELSKIGIFNYRQEVVGDNAQRIKAAIVSMLEDVDLLITTGGLGPTSDDITREVVAELYQKQIVLHEEALQKMKDIFRQMGREMPEMNIKQAMIPEGAQILVNNRGTAPGVLLETNDNKIIILLPGPPREMKPMFLEEVKPYLQNKSEVVLVSDTVHLFGIGESNAENMLSSEILQQTNPTVAPYAKGGEVIFRITSLAKTVDEGKRINNKTVKYLTHLYKDYVYGINMEPITKEICHKLEARDSKIAIIDAGMYGRFSNFLTKRTMTAQHMATVEIGTIALSEIVDYQDIEQYLAAQAKQLLIRSGVDYAIMLYLYISKAKDGYKFGDMWIAIATNQGESVEHVNLDRGYKDDVERIKDAAVMWGAYQFYNKLK